MCGVHFLFWKKEINTFQQGCIKLLHNNNLYNFIDWFLFQINAVLNLLLLKEFWKIHKNYMLKIEQHHYKNTFYILYTIILIENLIF